MYIAAYKQHVVRSVYTLCRDYGKGTKMMYLEHDWTFNVYRVRFGSTFIDWRGYRSFASRKEAHYILALTGNHIGRKTDSRTWEIV